MPLPVPIDRAAACTRLAADNVAGLRLNTRVRRRCRRSKFPAEYPQRRCPNTIAPRRAVYGSAPGDGGDRRLRPPVRSIGKWWGGGRGITLARTRGHLISCHFQFCRLEILLSLCTPGPSAAATDDDNDNNLYKFLAYIHMYNKSAR